VIELPVTVELPSSQLALLNSHPGSVPSARSYVMSGDRLLNVVSAVLPDVIILKLASPLKPVGILL